MLPNYLAEWAPMLQREGDAVVRCAWEPHVEGGREISAVNLSEGRTFSRFVGKAHCYLKK